MLSATPFRNSLEPTRIFIFSAAFVGSILLFLTPPFQVPDEPHHFFRAYQVVTGTLFPERIGNGLGGHLPSAVVNTVREIQALRLEFNPSRKIDIDKVFSLLEKPTNPQSKQPCIFTNTAFYSPLPYLPQAIGIWISELFWPNPLVALYSGRLANMLMYLLLVYSALRVIPIQENMLIVVAMMPMGMFLAPSLSSDVFTIGVSMLFFAFIVKNALNKDLVQKTSLAAVLVLGFCIGQCKVGVYFPLVALVFMIKPSKLGGIRKFMAFASSVMLISLIPALLWLIYLKTIGNSFLVVKQPVGDPLNFIISKPVNYLVMLWNTFYEQGSLIARGFVGNLGWLDTTLPNFVMVFYPLAILIAAIIPSKETNPPMGLFQRLLGALVALGSIIVACTAIFISWPQVSSHFVNGLQGRYFIPIAPYVLLSMYLRNCFKQMRYLSWGIPIIVFVTWILTFVTLYYRYWSTESTPEIWRWMGVQQF